MPDDGDNIEAREVALAALAMDWPSGSDASLCAKFFVSAGGHA